MSFKLEGMDKVMVRFNGMVKRMSNSKPGMNYIAALAFRQVIQNFSDEVDDKGKSWEKWLHNGKRVSTRPTKRGGTKLLQDTGRLRAATKFSSNKREAIVSNNLKYAGVHNYGAPKKNIVARKFLWVSKRNILGYSKYYAKFLVGR